MCHRLLETGLVARKLLNAINLNPIQLLKPNTYNQYQFPLTGIVAVDGGGGGVHICSYFFHGVVL